MDKQIVNVFLALLVIPSEQACGCLGNLSLLKSQEQCEDSQRFGIGGDQTYRVSEGKIERLISEALSHELGTP